MLYAEGRQILNGVLKYLYQRLPSDNSCDNTLRSELKWKQNYCPDSYSELR